MNRLVRLYPTAWRERYGDEMEALLDERPLGPFDLVDLLLGALDAHQHVRGLGQAPEHEKGFIMSSRIAGIAAVSGGTFWGLTWAIVILEELIGGGSGNVPFAFVTLFVAAIGTLVALAGLSAIQSHVHRRSTWLSFLAPAAGLVLMLVGFLAMPFADGFWSIGMGGLLLYMVGVALFGAVTYMAAVFSRPAAGLLAIGGALGCLSFAWVLESGGDDVAPWVVLAWVVFMAISWILLGVDAVRRDGSTVVQGPSAA